MYAFSSELRQAWQALFNQFYRLFDDGEPLDKTLVFDTGESVLRDPGLFIGHTCGYPLMKHLQNVVTPLCVPVFNVNGVEGRLYSSRFIVATDSDIDSLADSAARTAVINDTCSNSGMNVLRHAIAALDSNAPFFAAVINSGGHLQSLAAVAENRADIAAIDCVSYQLIKDRWPELTERVRSIGDSVKTCGLPLVMPGASFSSSDTRHILGTLNNALEQLEPRLRHQLHLSHFESVSFDDYQSILEVESFAMDAGYPELK